MQLLQLAVQCRLYMSETIVMSVGGSLIVPGEIDVTFLSALKQFVDFETATGRRFIIIAGGGKTARNYQDAAAAVRTAMNRIERRSIGGEQREGDVWHLGPAVYGATC